MICLRSTRCEAASLLLLLVAGWLLPISAPAQFVGFFDHARGTGTHPHTLSFYATTNGASGLFTNISDGVTTSVRLITTTNGTGSAISVGTLAGNPAAGTPAYETFNGFVDFSTNTAAAIQIPQNSFLVYTFSNLNPNARYSFKGTAIRGNPTYTNRWGKVTIGGADAATPHHTSNALTSANAPADLGPNDVAINFGVNHLPNQGDMAVWDDIVPGPDGIFQVICTRYTGFVPNGSSVAGSPPYGYAISGIRLEEITTPPDPIVITSGPDPSSLMINQREQATFTVEVSGSAPHFEWYREDGLPIHHAVATNSPVLTLTNADPGDSAIYRLRITNSVNEVTSGPAQLIVNPDTTPPHLASGLGLVTGNRFILRFSEALDTSHPLSLSQFHIHKASGAGDLVPSAAEYTNTTDVLITTAAAREPNVNYVASADSNAVFDKAGNGSTAGTVPLALEVFLVSFTNTVWRYNTDGFDLGIDFADPGFDDSTWPEGPGILDGKVPQARATVGGFAVNTQLPLTNSIYPSLTGVIPTYYFRTHFVLPAPPERILELRLRTVIDDFDNLYLNALEIYRNPGYPATNPPPAFGYSGGTAVGTAAAVGPFDVSPVSLVSGDNVLATIVNQVNGSSSDITCGYELIATIEGFGSVGPQIAVSRDPVSGIITITWPASTGAQLYEATSADASEAQWTLVTGASDGSYTTSAAGGQRFFTLRR